MEKRIKETEKAAGKPAASFVTVAYQANGALLSRDSKVTTSEKSVMQAA